MNQPKFNFGDYVYQASVQSGTVLVPCPDCNGDRYVTITYRGETYTIDCPGCERGYFGSTGLRERHSYDPIIREGVIAGLEHNGEEFEYRISTGRQGSFWILKESDTFSTKEEAEARAVVLKAEWDAKEAERVLEKHRPDRSWAWNIQYYKGNIERARKDLEYYTLKLNAAKKHAKEVA